MHEYQEANALSTVPSRRFIITFFAIAVTTVVLSTLELAFKVQGSSIYHEATDNGHLNRISSLRPDSKNNGLRLAQYPHKLGFSETNISIAGAIVSLVVAFALSLACVFAHRQSRALPVSRYKRLAIAVILLGNSLLSWVSFVFCCVHRFRSATFHPSYRSPSFGYTTYGPNSDYDGGVFNLGSWSCQLSAYSSYDDNGDFLRHQCIDESAALWISLLVAMGSVGILTLLWYDWRGARAILRDHSVADAKDEDVEIGEVWQEPQFRGRTAQRRTIE